MYAAAMVFSGILLILSVPIFLVLELAVQVPPFWA